MDSLLTVLRRTLWIVVLAAAGGIVYGWWRERSVLAPAEPPAWPPLDPEPGEAPTERSAVDAAPAPATTPDPDSASTAGPAPGSDSASTAGAATDSDSASTAGTAPAASPTPASVVNALVDTPDARSSAGVEARWVEPLDDGSCPAGHPIKANDNSGIFHVPGGRFYDRTRPERCYADPDAAVADGYRQAKQ